MAASYQKKNDTTRSSSTCLSRNIAVTGLTGRSVLLSSEDVDEYTVHLSRQNAEYLPATEVECELVQTIADCDWRLRRILEAEEGIYALGESQFGDAFTDEPKAVRKSLLKAQTLLIYDRQLNHLAIQEYRLQVQKMKAIAALEACSKNRPQAPAGGVSAVMPATACAAAASSAVGFEFSPATDHSGMPSFFPEISGHASLWIA